MVKAAEVLDRIWVVIQPMGCVSGHHARDYAGRIQRHHVWCDQHPANGQGWPGPYPQLRG